MADGPTLRLKSTGQQQLLCPAPKWNGNGATLNISCKHTCIKIISTNTFCSMLTTRNHTAHLLNNTKWQLTTLKINAFQGETIVNRLNISHITYLTKIWFQLKFTKKTFSGGISRIQRRQENYKKLSYRRETARQLCMSTYSWLTDRAMHRTQQNRRGCTISDTRTLWFKKCWPKTHFVMKYPLEVIQGHSLCNHLPVDKG